MIHKTFLSIAVKPTHDQITSLLAEKRQQVPDEEYWQRFLCEFHSNQRQRELNSTGVTGIVSRFGRWISEMGLTRFAYGFGLAYAGVTAVYLLTPPSVGEERIAPTPASYQIVPAAHAGTAVQSLPGVEIVPRVLAPVEKRVF